MVAGHGHQRHEIGLRDPFVHQHLAGSFAGAPARAKPGRAQKRSPRAVDPAWGMNGSDSGTGTSRGGAGAGSWRRRRRQTMPPPDLPDMATGCAPPGPAGVAGSPGSRSSEGSRPSPPWRAALPAASIRVLPLLRAKKIPGSSYNDPGMPLLILVSRRPPDPRGEAVSFQAGILTPGSSSRRVFPTMRSVTLGGVRPRLQRRARLRFSRSSLLFHNGT